MTEQKPEAPARTTTRRRLIGVAIGLVVVILAWGGYDLYRAQSIWPETMPPLELPPPAIPVHPEALTRLDGLIDAAGDLDADHHARVMLLEASGLPDPPSWPPDPPEPHAALDRLLATGGVAIEPETLGDSPARDLLPLIHVDALRRIRAAKRAAAGDLEGAWRDVVDTWTLGHRLAHSGGQLIATMIGLAIERGALDTAGRLLDAGRWSPGASALATALDAAAERPSPLVAALTGECLSIDAMLVRIGQTSAESIDEMAPGDGELTPAPPGIETADDTWLYDSHKTRAYARTRCRYTIEAAGRPAPQRTPPPPADLGETRWYEVGPMLDNPMGRILLAIAQPEFHRFLARADRVAYNRRRVRLAIARATYTAEIGRPPTALTELIPQHLPAAPADPFTDQPMPLDPPPAPEVD